MAHVMPGPWWMLYPNGMKRTSANCSATARIWMATSGCDPSITYTGFG